MPAVPSSFIEPLWVQFKALIPPREDTHPLGCHNPRIPDRVVFDKLVAKLVFGGSYQKHSDATCSATTMRTRRDQWIAAGVFTRLEQIVLDAYDQMVGLDLANITIDGRHAKAPCGGECAGRSPVDRRKLGIKWSQMTDGAGIPLGGEIAGGNQHDSPLPRPTLERLSRFGSQLPHQITVPWRRPWNCLMCWRRQPHRRWPTRWGGCRGSPASTTAVWRRERWRVHPLPRGWGYASRRAPRRVQQRAVSAAAQLKSAERGRVLLECKSLARRLTAIADVVAVTVYEAVLIPPAKASPRFDVLVLIQTTSPETIATVEASEAYQLLDADFVMAGRNSRRIGDIDHPKSGGAFLFNHFTAADPERALRTWEDIAGWFTHKAGVDDSAVLQPTGEAPYVFVNHVRLPCSPIRFFLRLLKPSFRRSVSRKLSANKIGFAAVVCKPV